MTAEQKGIRLRIESDPNLSPVQVDLERMVQVIDNLILNAFRYTPRGGEVVLSARNLVQPGTTAASKATSGAVQFQVRDNGSGISPDDLPYIFDRFYRGDKARQQSGESGLGLAIAKSIVEAHGGTISAESKLGQGTVFTITLA